MSKSKLDNLNKKSEVNTMHDKVADYIKKKENEIKSGYREKLAHYTIGPYFLTKSRFWYEVNKNSYKYEIKIHFVNNQNLSTKICNFVAPLLDYEMKKYSRYESHDVTYIISISGFNTDKKHIVEYREIYEKLYKVEEFLFGIFKERIIRPKESFEYLDIN